jgi:hypothetical protein
MGSSSPEANRLPRAKFEEFVRRILAVPKSALDERLDEEKRKKGERPKRPPAPS